jgi:hypothetical protein
MNMPISIIYKNYIDIDDSNFIANITNAQIVKTGINIYPNGWVYNVKTPLDVVKLWSTGKLNDHKSNMIKSKNYWIRIPYRVRETAIKCWLKRQNLFTIKDWHLTNNSEKLKFIESVSGKTMTDDNIIPTLRTIINQYQMDFALNAKKYKLLEINYLDIVQEHRCRLVVERLIGRTLTNEELFIRQHTRWRDRNQELMDMLNNDLQPVGLKQPKSMNGSRIDVSPKDPFILNHIYTQRVRKVTRE